jgi:type VI protein secretion system component Hcp
MRAGNRRSISNATGPQGPPGPSGLAGPAGKTATIVGAGTLTLAGGGVITVGGSATPTIAPVPVRIRPSPHARMVLGTGSSALNFGVFGWSQQSSIRSATSAAGGKRTLGEFEITKKVDSASPKLSQACSDGRPFPSGQLVAHTSGGAYLRFDFKLVYVTTVQFNAATGGQPPQETITFVYERLAIRYVQQRPALGHKHK